MRELIRAVFIAGLFIFVATFIISDYVSKLGCQLEKLKHSVDLQSRIIIKMDKKIKEMEGHNDKN